MGGDGKIETTKVETNTSFIDGNDKKILNEVNQLANKGNLADLLKMKHETTTGKSNETILESSGKNLEKTYLEDIFGMLDEYNDESSIKEITDTLNVINNKGFGELKDATIYSLDGGTIGSQADQGGTMTKDEMNNEVEGGYEGYTDKESTVIIGEDIDKNGNIIKYGPPKTIALKNGITCTYQLNEHVYKSEIKKDNWFFENGEVIGKYEFKNKEGKILKNNTVSIKEWGNNEYVELDDTSFNDYDNEIKRDNNGKPDIELALNSLIKLYAKEEPDDLIEGKDVIDKKIEQNFIELDEDMEELKNIEEDINNTRKEIKEYSKKIKDETGEDFNFF